MALLVPWMPALSYALPLEQERCCWPKDARALLQVCTTKHSLRRAVLLQRIDRLEAAEATLLAALQSAYPSQRCLALDLLAGLQQRRQRPHWAQALVQQADDFLAQTGSAIAPAQRAALEASLKLRRRQLQDHPTSNVPPDASQHSPLQWLQALQDQLVLQDLQGLDQSLKTWPPNLKSPEALELKALALRALGQREAAMRTLDQLLQRGYSSALAWQQTLQLNNAAGRSNGLALAMASRQHPCHAEIGHLRNAIQLMKRQSAAGRRSAFQERLQYSLGTPNAHPGESDGNLLTAYDQTGCSHLMPWLHPKAWQALELRPLLCSNLVMQLASQSHPRAVEATERLASRYVAPMPFSPGPTGNPLRVALVSPDFGYHPVGRFVQMLLEAGLGQDGTLFLASTQGTPMPRTQELAGSQLINLYNRSEADQVQLMRDLKLDVAVDLTGWTANHSGHLFAPRIAPLQINYLGYYASSGLPSMDAWLGDQALFPTPMQEWHSERIVRLPRAFLAWKPSSHLPEGTVEVPPGPDGPITFGCFNHARKLSAATLTLWAKLLEAVPSAQLALKAFASDDPGVAELIKRRMRRCGLPLERVIWLPTTARPEDHLRQYGLMDIGLDPFPNGGCTTTCEALWMGVPVITLRGSHYVGRMSTAVLTAADLPHYIADNEDAYLRIAVDAAARVNALRQGRRTLRGQMQTSALGDAEGLATALWSCWGALRQRRAA